jgi:hypothetical protein
MCRYVFIIAFFETREVSRASLRSLGLWVRRYAYGVIQYFQYVQVGRDSSTLFTTFAFQTCNATTPTKGLLRVSSKRVAPERRLQTKCVELIRCEIRHAHAEYMSILITFQKSPLDHSSPFKRAHSTTHAPTTCGIASFMASIAENVQSVCMCVCERESVCV